MAFPAGGAMIGGPARGAFDVSEFGASPGAASSQNLLSMQSAFDSGKIITFNTPGAYLQSGVLLSPSGLSLVGQNKAVLKLDTNANQGIIRNGNATFLPTFNIAGVWICYADTQAYGTGVLSYTASGQTLSWRAPGDLSGVPIAIGAGGMFRVNSASADKAITVMVAPFYLSATNVINQSVRVSANRGSVKVSMVRAASATVTVTEVGHTREINAPFESLGHSSADCNGGFVVATVPTVDTWTFTATASGTDTSTAYVFGDSYISLDSVALDGNEVNQGTTGYNATNHTHGLYFRCVHHLRLLNTVHRNQRKYCLNAVHCVDVYADHPIFDTVSDGFDFRGRGDEITIRSPRGKTGDDMFGLGCERPLGTYAYVATGIYGGFPRVRIYDVKRLPGAGSAVRFCGNTGDVFNLLVDGVDGISDQALIKLDCDTVALTGTRAQNITVMNFARDVPYTTTKQIVVVANGARCENLTLIPNGRVVVPDDATVAVVGVIGVEPTTAVAGLSASRTASASLVVLEASHTRAIGDWVTISGYASATGNGSFRITAISAGVSWTVTSHAGSSDSGTVTASIPAIVNNLILTNGEFIAPTTANTARVIKQNKVIENLLMTNCYYENCHSFLDQDSDANGVTSDAMTIQTTNCRSKGGTIQYGMRSDFLIQAQNAYASGIGVAIVSCATNADGRVIGSMATDSGTKHLSIAAGTLSANGQSIRFAAASLTGVDGDMIYDTADGRLEQFDGGVWAPI